MIEHFIKATAELLADCAKHAVDCWERGLNDKPDRRAVVYHPAAGGKFRYICLDLDRVYEVDPGSLLLDLSIPAVRDRVARVLAERLGLECGATAPGWEKRRECWVLWGHGWSVVFAPEQVYVNRQSEPPSWLEVINDTLAAISETEDPAHALALAWRAVEESR